MTCPFDTCNGQMSCKLVFIRSAWQAFWRWTAVVTIQHSLSASASCIPCISMPSNHQMRKALLQTSSGCTSYSLWLWPLCLLFVGVSQDRTGQQIGNACLWCSEDQCLSSDVHPPVMDTTLWCYKHSDITAANILLQFGITLFIMQHLFCDCNLASLLMLQEQQCEAANNCL